VLSRYQLVRLAKFLKILDFRQILNLDTKFQEFFDLGYGI
jgi:hypothetical protein